MADEPEVMRADYSEQALAERCIDFLDERADQWMADTGVQRMFNALASVFERHASQEIMDRFRQQMAVVGRQCHVEGAFRVWEEICAQQRAIGRPLPADAADFEHRLTAERASAEREARLREAVAQVISAVRAYLPPDGIGKDAFISRVIEATDNSDLRAALGEPTHG